MIRENNVVIRIDMSIYDKVATLKTCYVFQDRCHTSLAPESETIMIATLTSKKESLNIQDIEDEFMDELIDQQIRIENDKLFAGTRKMIVEQAFKPISFAELKGK
jgi:His-Xaa-Ser system protein HxsD